ncbi:MAG: hypothetical protein AB7U48_03360 [Bauldia sp.]
MSVKNGLLATLSTLALSTASITTAAASGAEPLPGPAPADDGFYGLVTALADQCLVEQPEGYAVIVGDMRISQCCAVLRQLGPENMDFLQAVALGDRNDPRLAVLNPDLVTVLLNCQEVAIERITELALSTVPAAGPGTAQACYVLYTG